MSVIALHTHRLARANGAATAVAIAARRLGFDDAEAITQAERARQRVRSGQSSAARAVSVLTAQLRERAQAGAA